VDAGDRRYKGELQHNDRLTLSFYSEQYRKALQICGTKSGRKLFKAPMQELDFIDKSILAQWFGGSHGGLHDVYIVEMEKVFER